MTRYEEQTEGSIMKKATQKTLVICETMDMVLDLTKSLGGTFSEKPDFEFESDDYILRWGCPIHVLAGKPDRLRQVYQERYRKCMKREDVSSIVWYSVLGSDYIDAAKAFLAAIEDVGKKEYAYYDIRGKHGYKLYLELLEEIGKSGEPADDMYYPPIPYDDIDGFFVAHVEPRESGLPYQILIDSLGMEEDDIPMVGVVVGDEVIFISVGESPENLSRKPFEGEEQIKAWIRKYRKPLYQHWKRELTDREVLIEVSKP